MTTQTPVARVLAWRAEIAAELKEAKKALPPLQAAHEAAIAAAREAIENFSAVQNLLKPITQETAIRNRMDAHRAEIDKVKGRKARAAADLEAARSRVMDLQRAIVQIDRVIPPEEETEEAAA